MQHDRGDYALDGAALRVGSTATTDMGCDPARHAEDEWLAGFLSARPAWEESGQGIVLSTEDASVTFVDRAVVHPDVALVGTTWVVDGFVNGEGSGASVSSARGDAAGVVFDPNGFVTGHDGCNDFGYGGTAGDAPTDGLRYEVDGAEISFRGAPASTLIACPEVDVDRFWAVLSGESRWEVDGSRLTLIDRHGQGVTFVAGE